MLVLLLAIALGTLVSEDASAVAAGLLIRGGRVGALSGIAACGAGILAGYWALCIAGRLVGHAALSHKWIARRLTPARLNECRLWLERRGAAAIVASRFLPGTRLPLYVAAGVARVPLRRFASWTTLAVLLWTPLIVLFAAWTGEALGERLATTTGVRWLPALVAAASVLALVKAARVVAVPSARRRLLAQLARWRRWEFWPMWLFYAPVALWIAWLAIRHRGLSTIAAANPGLPDGGVVGESKFEILSKLTADDTVQAALIPPGPAPERARLAKQQAARRGWTFPLILKPDVGQRGVGVRLVRDDSALGEYLSGSPGAVMLQPYHEGPHEAGVFYCRFPHERTGRILSVTHKEFPVVTGDGTSTLEELVWAHPRYRLQARLFLRRHRDAARRVLGHGERFQLALAGNHSQGTTFRDGSHLWTPALEARIDEIARCYPGFFIGRFDIRYRDVDAFRAGRDMAIVELNGTTAEPTDLYDPDRSLLEAYRQLFRHWSRVFAIGAANRARGAHVSSGWRLAALLRAHLTARQAFAISD